MESWMPFLLTDEKKSSLQKRFIRVYLSQNFEDMFGSKISTDLENAPENGSFAAYFMYHKESYMKSIGGKLRGQDKAKWGTLQDWLKSKMDKHILLLYWWVQDS